MTAVPAGLREALTEAAHHACHEGRMWPNTCNTADCWIARDAAKVVRAQLPVLVSWLAVHDAEVRQQGRNEAASDIERRRDSPRVTTNTANILDWAARVARGGSDLKGQDDE